MTQIEFVGQSSRDSDNLAANSARLVNMYREPVAGAGRSSYTLKSVPGMAPFSQADGIYCRALTSVDGKMYGVFGDDLTEFTAGGSAIKRGSVDGGGNTTMAGNNGVLTIVTGGMYYNWNGTTISEPTAGAFSMYGSHDYIGNYTVLTELDGRRFQWSNIADASDLPGLNFSTADGRDDNLIRPFAINGVLYLFKETSHEVWYLTGGAGASAFERQSGGVYDVGLKSHDLIARFAGGAFFVGDDGRVYIVSGTAQPVSIPPVETAIKNDTPSVCVAYDDEGHTFCAIVFTDRPAWVYDIALGEWHERSEGVNLGPWSATATVKANGSWYCGTSDSGMFRLVSGSGDRGGVLTREITSRTLYRDGQRFPVSEIEIFPRQGFGAGTVELLVSRDGGLTWTEPKPRQIGPVGNYGGRVIWRSLGLCRQFTAKLRFSEDGAFTALAEGRIA